MPALIPGILFEDQHLIVVNKPAGLLSQGESTGDENLVDWLRLRVGRNYVGLIHRLDRNTSGALVLAKRTKSAQRLTEALQSGKLERIYIAGLVGDLGAVQNWSHWLLKDERTNITRVVKPGTAGAKSSALSVRPLQTSRFGGTPITLAEFRLETGRSHQIRVQAAAEGFPLLGDTKYFGSAQPGPGRAAFGRPALHSWKIAFPHPMSGEPIRLTAPLPEDMTKLLSSVLPSEESSP